MTVYIVTTGEYSDYHIDRVFTNRDQAAAYCATRNGGIIHNYYLEEWDTDKCEIQTDKKVNRVWWAVTDVRVSNLRRFDWCETFETKDEIIRDSIGLVIYITTDLNCDIEKAKRIMQDRLARWRYEHNVC